MTAAELLSQAENAGVRLWLQDNRLKFDAPAGALTAELRAALSSRRDEIIALLRARDRRRAPIQPADRSLPMPLSSPQQRLWFLEQLTPGTALYNLGGAVRVAGPLDVAALTQALNEVVRRHESLRTTFHLSGPSPVQVIAPSLELTIAVCDGSDGAVEDRDEAARRWALERLRRPFDLGAGPLIRADLLRQADADHVLLLALHHVVADGWSLGVLVHELDVLYDAFASGRPSPLAAPGLQYADYAVWQQQAFTEDALERDLSYWREALHGELPRLDLPFDRPRPAAPTFGGAKVIQTLPRQLGAALKALARGEGVTLFVTLLAAFQVLLARHASQDDVVVGTPVANRRMSELETMIGFFVNTLVLRTDLSGDPTFRELLARVRQVVLGALEHQDLPFERLVEALRPEREVTQTPLFQVMFALQNAPVPAASQADRGLRPLPIDSGTAKFDLTVSVEERGDELSVVWEYSTDLWDATSVERLSERYRLVLEAAVDAGRRISDLPLMTEVERRQIVAAANDTRVSYPDTSCVHHLFEAQAERRPDAVAVQIGSASMTYGDMNRRANQLAHHLRALGVGPDIPVGIRTEPSFDQFVALLGILKAGGAYVPLDPQYPAERIAGMLADTRVRVLVTQEHLTSSLAASAAQVVRVDADWPAIAARETTNPAVAMSADHLAYIIFTSGSTGRPKGVEVPHRGVLRLLFGIDYVSLGPDEVLLQLAPLAFDASTFEIWGALLHGAVCAAFPDRVPTTAELGAVLRRHRVTTLWLTASLFNLIVDEAPEALAGVRQLLIGGEALSVAHVRRALDCLADTSIINGYGPTESTTFTCCYPIPRPVERALAGESISIGRPIANTQTFVLDRHLNAVPIGVVGELYIGGAGLARGYSDAPELTAARFVPNPFDDPGTRLYRTGDLVRLLDDGRLAFIGRTDAQVKIRGFRIEPAEIEAALRRLPLVKEAVVVVTADPAAGKRLVAYVVPSEGGDAALTDIKVALRTTLPDYMIPAAFVALDALPLTPNGKVDRRALPDVESGRSATAPLVAPRTALETTIADVWRDVLNGAAIGVHDNFFDLGGHSLQLIQVHRRLRAIVERPLSMIDLFRFPTVEALAGYLSGDAGQPTVGAPLAPPRPEAGRAAGAGAIAIVGMAGRFPGAKNVGEFWRNLRDGVESVQFFGDDELRAAGVDPSALSDPRYVRARAALDDIDMFDAPFFRYTPREAESIDPQHRLFLECAWEALEASGHDPAAFDGRVGVYAGAGGGDYAAWLRRNPQFLSSIGGLQTLLGTGRDFLPTRVSYKLNLRGPSINVQTACSTSLVAVHLACRALTGGECDMALAGGAALGVVQTVGYLYEEDGILSPDGHCRPFDARAKGTVPGSGVGIVVLRRLEDALADGDPIVAVIKGSAINNDGSDKIGYTAPALKGQAEVIAAAHAAAGVSPDSITYVEAHGTGTTLGDPVELTALTQALHGTGAPARSCAIGSLKSNMGHLDAAAGVAGLIKTALALRHRQLPPTLHFTEPNPEIDLNSGPFYVNTALTDWAAGPQPRRAGVSSFGIGGTNAHVVLEEAPPRTAAGPSRRWKLLPLSARTPEALNSAAANLRRHLEAHRDLDLADVAYTLQIGRRAFDCRRAIVCADRDGAIDALALAEGERSITGTAVRADRPVVFMFPGQGSQYPGMGRDLYEEEAVFRGEVDQCAAILQPLLALDIRELLYPATGTTDRAALDLRQTAVAQSALFATEYALARLWMHWGVRPHAVIGHSLGEYVAATVAGVFSLEDALTIVAARGRLMQQVPAGAMLAVPVSEEDLQRHLDDTMSIAAVNAPGLSVASGPPAAIDALHERLAAQGAPGNRLNTSHAFHSPMMGPILEAFRQELRRVGLQAPSIPCISGVTGTWLTDAQATDPDYWVRQLRQPVRFGNGIRELIGSSAGGGVLVEVGPGRTLSSLSKAQGISAPLALPSLPRPGDAETASERILLTLGRLWTEGIVVDWRRFTAGETRGKLALPTYPFERRRYRVEPSGTSAPAKALDQRRRAPFDEWFYAPSWRQSVAPHPQPDAEARWLVFTDDSGAGDALIGALAAAGRRVVTVEPGLRFGVVADDRYGIDPGSPVDYCTLMDALRARGHVPDRVVHLWTIGRELAGTDEPTRVERAFYSPVFLARALGRFLGERREPIEIAMITTGAHDVLGDESLDPVGAMAVGACRVIPLESPNLTCRAIDVDAPREAAAAARVAGDILREIDGGAPDVTVAYRNHRRWTPAVARLGADAFAAEPRLRNGGVYLVTGAFGGVGLEIAEWLARRWQARLVLVGRTMLPPREEWSRADARLEPLLRKLGAIEALGGDALTVQADVTSQPEMQAAVAKAIERFGCLHGVFHAAGAPKVAGLIEDVDRAACEAQFAPRLRAVQVLDRVLSELPIDFCVVTSSLASVLGVVGFSAYTAAHLYVDLYVRARFRQGAPWLTVNWDNWLTWKEAGHLRSSEIADFMMEPAQAVAALERALSLDSAPQVAVSTGDLQARIDQWVARRFLESAERPADSPVVSRHPRPTLSNPFEAPASETERLLASLWEELLGVAPIGVHDNFLELGGDSVVAIQVVARAGAAGLRLTARHVFEHQTIAALAASAGAAPRSRAEQGTVTGAVPLTPIQRWLLEQELTEPHCFNQAMLFETREPIDAAVLGRVAQKLAAHHDALRLRYSRGPAGWEQTSLEQAEIPVSVVDLSSLPADEQHKAIEAEAARLQGSLHLSDGPLMRLVMFDLGPGRRGRLLLVSHHLVVDAISWRVLLEDLEQGYAQARTGRAIQLPDKTTSFKRWAETLVELAHSSDVEREAEYWTGLPWNDVKPIAVDWPGGRNTFGLTQSVSAAFDAAETQTILQTLPERFAVEINDLLLAALGASFAQIHDAPRLAVDVEGHGRGAAPDDVDLSRTVGWFTTIYPVLLETTAGVDPAARVARVKALLRAVPEHGERFCLLRSHAVPDIQRRIRDLPPAQVSFLYLGRFDGAGASRLLAPAAESAGPGRSLRDNRPHMIEVSAVVAARQLHVSWTYSEELHRRSTIQRLSDGFTSALRELIVSKASAGVEESGAAQFPGAGLDRRQLDDFLAQMKRR